MSEEPMESQPAESQPVSEAAKAPAPARARARAPGDLEPRDHAIGLVLVAVSRRPLGPMLG